MIYSFWYALKDDETIETIKLKLKDFSIENLNVDSEKIFKCDIILENSDIALLIQDLESALFIDAMADEYVIMPNETALELGLY